MCGIVGMVLNTVKYANITEHLEAFKQLLFVDALRGEHGTGVIKITPPDYTKKLYNNEVTIAKEACTASEFLSIKEFDTFLSDRTTIALIGHNRHATKGAHTIENTHPFSYGDISLVHNGTLSFMREDLVPDDVKLEVDSQEIAYGLSLIKSDAIDYVAQVRKFLEKIEGAYTLVWYNSSLQTINFARNAERPLHYGFTEEGGLCFASEGNMLAFVAARSKLKLKEIISLPVGNWVSIDVTFANTAITLEEYSFKPAEKVYSCYDYYKGGYNKKQSFPTTTQSSLKLGDKVKGVVGGLTKTGAFHTVTLTNHFTKGYFYIPAEELKDFVNDYKAIDLEVTKVIKNVQLYNTYYLSVVTDKQKCSFCENEADGNLNIQSYIVCEECFNTCYIV
jgi:hypothetical protein